MRQALRLLATVILPIAAARAEPACEARMTALEPQVAAIADPHLHAVLDNDLRQARKEAAEGDEDECADILNHADRLLHEAGANRPK